MEEQVQGTPPAATPTPPAPTPAGDQGGYGKKSWGKWILIYLVIAVVAYGLYYFIWLRDSGVTKY